MTCEDVSDDKSQNWLPHPSFHLLRVFVPTAGAILMLSLLIAVAGGSSNDWVVLGLVTIGLVLVSSIRFFYWACSFSHRSVWFTERAIEIRRGESILASALYVDVRSVALSSGYRYPEWSTPGLFDRLVVDLPGFGETPLPELLVLTAADRESLTSFLEAQCRRRDMRMLGPDM